MYKGGAYYSPGSARIIRYAGLFVPIILVIYGLFILYGIIDTPHKVNMVGFYLMSFWWLAISVLQFVSKSKSALESALRLAAYHLLAGSYLIFISGIASPLVACWLLLLIASYVYFSKIGLQISLLSFVFVVVFDILIKQDIHPQVVTQDLVALVALLIIGVVTLSITKTQNVNKKALTKSKRNEKTQRDRMLTIVNNLTDAVLSTDEDGVIRVYNAASLALLDTNDSLVGKSVGEIFKITDTEGKKINLIKELEALKSVQKRDDIVYTISKDDSMRLELTLAPIRSSYSVSRKSESREGYIIIMRDITKMKSLEEERDEFISVVSHELRTPITIAEGAISNALVMFDKKDIDQKLIKKSIESSHDQVVFLSGMVNDLSTLSRAERGVAAEVEEIDVKELAHTMLNRYSDKAKAKKLQLNLDTSARLGSVSASRLYLEELLQNLITNAIKYTEEGEVTISFRQRQDVITFAIKDTGIGISKSDQAKIFDKFYRSEDYRTRETGGTGLGLYISAKLARKLGVKVQLTSRLNRGSTFFFEMPALNEAAKTTKKK